MCSIKISRLGYQSMKEATGEKPWDKQTFMLRDSYMRLGWAVLLAECLLNIVINDNN